MTLRVAGFVLPLPPAPLGGGQGRRALVPPAVTAPCKWLLTPARVGTVPSSSQSWASGLKHRQGEFVLVPPGSALAKALPFLQGTAGSRECPQVPSLFAGENTGSDTVTPGSAFVPKQRSSSHLHRGLEQAQREELLHPVLAHPSWMWDWHSTFHPAEFQCRVTPLPAWAPPVAVPGAGGVPEPPSHSTGGRGLEDDGSLFLALNTTQESFADVPSLPSINDWQPQQSMQILPRMEETPHHCLPWRSRECLS